MLDEGPSRRDRTIPPRAAGSPPFQLPVRRENLLLAKQSFDDISWLKNPKDVIVLANRSGKNYVLDLPTGRCRLDAGRKLRTLRSILDIGQIRDLVAAGQLAVEE